jgi:cytochrome c553
MIASLPWLAQPGVGHAQAPSSDDAPSNETCLGCHGQEGFGQEGFGQEGFAMARGDRQMRSLHVPKEKFGRSVLATAVPCVGCHQDITEVPHRNVPETAAELRQRIPDLCGMCLPLPARRAVTRA